MFGMTDDYIDLLLGSTVPSYQLTCKATRNLGLGGIYYGLTRALRPRKVVVIGSKAGFAPVVFAKALKDNQGHSIKFVDCEATELHHPDGKCLMHFIDPSYSIHREDDSHWYGLGAWDDPVKVKALWAKFGVEEVAEHFRLRSEDYLKQTDPEDKIDLLYVDGDHSYEGMMHDFVAFHGRLSDNAMVLAHDVDPTFQEAYPEAGGFKAFTDLPEHLYEKTRLAVYPGLAVMRKR